MRRNAFMYICQFSRKKIKDIEFKNIQRALEAKSAAAKSSSRSLSDSPGNHKQQNIISTRNQLTYILFKLLNVYLTTMSLKRTIGIMSLKSNMQRDKYRCICKQK